jgi:hypothetical protein
MGCGVMRKRRQRFEAEVAEIQKELLAIGAHGQAPPLDLTAGKPRSGDLDKAKRMTVTSSGLMATAFQLAGYAVATLALGRSMPARIVLEESAEYDLGRCSESDLDTIWAVGNLAAERRSSEGFPREPGRTVVIVKMEGDVGGTMRDTVNGAVDADRSAEAILDEHWEEIVHIARLLIDRGALSRDDVEAEVLEPEEATPAT